MCSDEYIQCLDCKVRFTSTNFKKAIMLLNFLCWRWQGSDLSAFEYMLMSPTGILGFCSFYNRGFIDVKAVMIGPYADD